MIPYILFDFTDADTVKNIVVALGVAFVSSGLFHQIFKAAMKKLVEKLTGTVGELKNQNIITQEQYDKLISEMINRETQLTDKVGEVLDKLPEAEAISRIDIYWQGVSARIEQFLNEIEGDDE